MILALTNLSDKCAMLLCSKEVRRLAKVLMLGPTARIKIHSDREGETASKQANEAALGFNRAGSQPFGAVCRADSN